MIHLVYAPGFSYAMEHEFPDHYRITETLTAIRVDDDVDCEELALLVQRHFAQGLPIVVIDPADVTYRLPDHVRDQLDDFIAKHCPDGEVW